MPTYQANRLALARVWRTRGAVKLLLKCGSLVDAKDESFGGTPLDWALYAWGNAPEKGDERGRYYEVLALLVRAGARFDPQWYEDDEDRRRAATKMQSDPRMLAALAV